VAIYVAEIQASIATFLEQYALADKILAPFINDNVPVSFWVLWADTKLAIGQAQTVLATLGPLVKHSSNQDDALLLRLAIAEKALDVYAPVWLALVQKRVELREARNDKEHAFDIALYYLNFTTNKELALKWAQINWQQAKLKEDAVLLASAQNLNKASQTPSSPHTGDGK
jgi:hypothetical protein